MGGTNPSLLEAMASNSLICAHQNEFNRSILDLDAFYFSSPSEVTQLIDKPIQKERFENYLKANLHKIETLFLWDKIIDDCEVFFRRILETKGGKDVR